MFRALYATNFFGYFNDNYQKMLGMLLLMNWVDADQQAAIIALAGALIVLPYIFLSPLSERLCRRFGKRNVLVCMKALEIPIVSLASLGFLTHNIPLILVALFLMGTQSCIYSPAKYGLIRDIGGVENVSTGMGTMESFSFLGMFLGVCCAAAIVDYVPLWVDCSVLVAIAVAGFVSSLCVRCEREATVPEKESLNPFKFLHQAHATAAKYHGLNPVIYVLSIFWWFMITMQQSILVFCEQSLDMSNLGAGFMLILASVGVSLGCVFAGRAGKHHSQAGLVSLYGFLLALGMLLFFCFAGPHTIRMVGLTGSRFLLAVVLLVSAIIGGFFKVPLDTAMQTMEKPEEVNAMLAYFNQTSFICMFLASLTYWLITLVLPLRYVYLMMSVVMLLTIVYLIFSYTPCFGHVFSLFSHLRYKISIEGLEHVAAKRTHLILPNHPAYMEPMLLFSEVVRRDIRIHTMTDELFFRNALYRRVLSLVEAIKVPDLMRNRSKEALAQAARLTSLGLGYLEDGKSLVFYPSGHITLTGVENIGARRLAYETVRALIEAPEDSVLRDVDIILAKVRGLETSRFSWTKDKLLSGEISVPFDWKHPKPWHRREVSIRFYPMTEQVKQWALENDKAGFNRKLEEWYNC